MPDMYAIRGEVNYKSQTKKIGGEFCHIGEVIREIGISNSYDAKAKHIHLFPLYLKQHGSAIIVVDDGVGMDNVPRTDEELNGCAGHAKSSLASFFHIGHSTRRAGFDIGQFCMGSNLALAQTDVLFVLVTRTQSTPPNQYWVIVQRGMQSALDDPTDELNAEMMELHVAKNKTLLTLDAINPQLSANWTEIINNAFQKLSDKQGTLQLYIGKETPFHTTAIMDIDQPSWSRSKKQQQRSDFITDDIQATQLYTYICFQTRHGSVLKFPSAEGVHGLRERNEVTLLNDTREATVLLYNSKYKEGYNIPYGFPYLKHDVEPQFPEKLKASQPINSKAAYWCRLGPKEFERDDKSLCALYIAMDCYTYRITQYEGLDRQGHARSGVGMCKVTGVLLSSHGVPITTLSNDFFIHLPTTINNTKSRLTEHTKNALLQWKEKNKFNNLLIIIDGIYEMRTDRNSITPLELQRLKQDERFLIGCANSIQDFRNGNCAHSKNFDAILDYMSRNKKEDDEKNTKENMEKRARETMEDGCVRITAKPNIPQQISILLSVIQETCSLSDEGHEHMLVHLFGMYGSVIRAIERCIDSEKPEYCKFMKHCRFWPRVGQLYNGSGVDVQVFKWNYQHDHLFLAKDKQFINQMSQIEFKEELEKEFNHPFLSCESGIVIRNIKENVIFITDSQNMRGEIIHPTSMDDPLWKVGFYLRNIRNGEQEIMSPSNNSRALEIKVFLFDQLLAETLQLFATVDIRRPMVIFPVVKDSKEKKPKY